MSEKLYIPILLGTMRQGRYSEHVAKMILNSAQDRDGMEFELFDVRDFNFPLDDEGQGIKEQTPKWRDAIIKADGLIVVSPEYNHGYPGSLKMALDTLLKEYIHKPVALCGVSAGGFGGARVIEQLACVVRELGLAVTFRDLNVSHVQKMFSEQGDLQDDSILEKVDGMLDELEWMAKALRWGRDNLNKR